MSLVGELAAEIWAESEFHADLALLGAANIRAELRDGGLIEASETFEVERLRRMMQAALVFAESNEHRYQDAAQRISTATLRLAGPAAKDLFAMVQARLRNFPALRTSADLPIPPLHAPMSLQYEFVERRLKQTIVASDTSEHVLTPFQLESWNLLAGGSSGALSGPTSAGKSYVLLLYLIERFRAGELRTAAYVVPTRALINQVSDDAAAALAGRGVRDVSITSVPVDLSSPDAGKVLYVLTQERLDALLVANSSLRLDLILVDEAQMISDGSRGILLESVLDRVENGDDQPQIVFSGPLINNPDYFGDLFRFKAFGTSVSKRSPVTQNIVFLDYAEAPDPQVSVKVLAEVESVPVATVNLPIRLHTDLDRLSYMSVLFGRAGSSIVYAGGKADAEKIAIKIGFNLPENQAQAGELAELIGFVKKHVHKEYALVDTLEKGVGFHYGHMPSLLRKQLENQFRERKIHYLVCTSTLLYGLNLPARNIFLEKPSTGRGHAISGPDFWNLSGRAGRMGQELEGNVFLIDYEKWESQPLAEARGVSVSSALKAAVVDQGSELLAFLNDPSISSDTNLAFEITLGKLVLDQRLGRLGQTLDRYARLADAETLVAIHKRIEQISAMTDIPTEVLNSNIGVSIFRQNDLLNYMIKRLKKLAPEELIPAHPLGDFKEVLDNHRRAFRRIHTYLLNYAGRDGSHNFFAPLALRWMRGDPLPILIDSAIRYHRDKKSGKSVARIIRETMENVEQELRFRYVKYFTCYNAILRVALVRVDKADYVKNIPEIPLFLEVGGSSGVMINLMALGLSRTSAESLAEYITDKEISLPDLRVWLQQLRVKTLDISPICMREIQAIIDDSVGPDIAEE
ncbi:DEAD/DEAH box helicase-like [Acetobacter pasteurianus NBRC 101655]|uniref:DEAD/DEAH box helicase n=1 Tax=Acetobacter pasteurianus TaxID=438 RepID=UPI0002457B90|nr:DEAD/DEAH box helicase [Acetobacter pasteurianus]BAU38709.1 DEAD/DEAH box helicase-like [Acetobacter pasteurianus NBRC 101655]